MLPSSVHASDGFDDVEFDDETGADEEESPMTQPLNPVLPEAAFSVNFRMVMEGETHQFTVRSMNASEFLSAYTMLKADLRQMGFTFPGYAPQPTQVQQAQQNPVNGTQPAAQRPAPAAQAPATTQYSSNAAASMGWVAKNIDGYVVGSVNNKDGVKPVVWLYETGMNFKSFTIYPERPELLPFPFPAKIEWNGSAPRRDEVQARPGMWHAVNMVLNVLPDHNDDGSVKMNAKGTHVIYRVPTKAEAQAIGAPVAGPPSIPVEPGKNALDGESLAWAMSDHNEVAKEYKIPEPLDEWYVAQRNELSKVMDGDKVKKATPVQFGMLSDWVRDVATNGDYTTVIPIEGIGNVPLAGVLTGILVDRFALEPDNIPAELAVYLLQRISKMKGNVLNNLYDELFSENLAEVVRLGFKYLVEGSESPF